MGVQRLPVPGRRGELLQVTLTGKVLRVGGIKEMLSWLGHARVPWGTRPVLASRALNMGSEAYQEGLLDYWDHLGSKGH